MSKTTEQLQAEMQAQANRLHHLSMLYVGAIAELAEGRALGMIPQNRPGLKTTRDILDLMLFIRAEMNGLTRILMEANIVTQDRLLAVFAEEYRIEADAKAAQFGCESTAAGLKYTKP
jgi:hypothetical protein